MSKNASATTIDFAILATMRVKPIGLARLRAEFLGLYDPAANLASRKHHARFRLIFDRLEALGVVRTSQLNLDLVTRFIAARPPGQSPHTLKSLLNSLKTICSHAETARYLSVSPFRLKGIRHWVKAPRPTGKRHCNPAEIRRVLDVMKGDVAARTGWGKWRAHRLYALTATVAYTGIRAGEAQRLHVADIDLEQGVVNIVPRGKSLKTPGSEQPVAMPPGLKPILEAWLKDRLSRPKGFVIPPAEEIPWLFPNIRRRNAWLSGPPGAKPLDRLKAVAARAGVVMTFQVLRRSWATIAEALGVPQGLISRQLRHSDVRTTKEWYQERDLDMLKDSVEHFEL